MGLFQFHSVSDLRATVSSISVFADRFDKEDQRRLQRLKYRDQPSVGNLECFSLHGSIFIVCIVGPYLLDRLFREGSHPMHNCILCGGWVGLGRTVPNF